MFLTTPSLGLLTIRYLYDILSNKFAQDEKLPILIACNKSDLITAFKKERVQSLLEAEMYEIPVLVWTNDSWLLL